MAREVHRFAVVVQPGSTPAAPVKVELPMPPRVVHEVEIVVPPGPRGMVGFALGSGGNPVIPYKSGQWIVTDDEKIYWPLTEQISSGAWQCFAYNQGQYAHTLEFRFLVDLPEQIGVTGPVNVGPSEDATLFLPGEAPAGPPAPNPSNPLPAVPLGLVGAGLHGA